MLTARGDPDEAGVMFVVWLLDLQNAVLTLSALIRWYAADPGRPERKLFGSLFCYQLVFQALLFYNHHFLAGNAAYGPEHSAITNISLGVIAACALYAGPLGPAWKASASFSRLTRAASPVVLTALLTLVSLALVRVHYLAGAAGVLIAALAYALRNTQNQARHIERGDALKQQRSALQMIAWSDVLTGLANRRHLDQQLESMVRSGQWAVGSHCCEMPPC